MFDWNVLEGICFAFWQEPTVWWTYWQQSSTTSSEDIYWWVTQDDVMLLRSISLSWGLSCTYSSTHAQYSTGDQQALWLNAVWIICGRHMTDDETWACDARGFFIFTKLTAKLFPAGKAGVSLGKTKPWQWKVVRRNLEGHSIRPTWGDDVWFCA